PLAVLPSGEAPALAGDDVRPRRDGLGVGLLEHAPHRVTCPFAWAAAPARSGPRAGRPCPAAATAPRAGTRARPPRPPPPPPHASPPPPPPPAPPRRPGCGTPRPRRGTFPPPRGRPVTRRCGVRGPRQGGRASGPLWDGGTPLPRPEHRNVR